MIYAGEFLVKSAMQSRALLFGKLSLEASVNFNKRWAEGSVTYCEATQRIGNGALSALTAKIKSDCHQMNSCLQRHILIHLQHWAHTCYKKLLRVKKGNSSILHSLKHIFYLLASSSSSCEKKPCDSGKDYKYLAYCNLEKEKGHVPIWPLSAFDYQSYPFLCEGSTLPAHLLLSTPLAGWHHHRALLNQTQEWWGRWGHARAAGRAGFTAGSLSLLEPDSRWCLSAEAHRSKLLCKEWLLLRSLEQHKHKGPTENSARGQILHCVSWPKFN